MTKAESAITDIFSEILNTDKDKVNCGQLWSIDFHLIRLEMRFNQERTFGNVFFTFETKF